MRSINLQIFFMEGVPEAFVVGCMQNNSPKNAKLGKLVFFVNFVSSVLYCFANLVHMVRLICIHESWFNVNY